MIVVVTCRDFIGAAKSINPHRTKEMSNPFTWLFFRHGYIRWKWGNPGTIISTTQYGRKNIYNSAQCIAFVTAMFPIAPER